MVEYSTLFNIIQPPKQYRLPTASNIDPPRLRDVSLSIQMVVTAKSKPDIEAAKILLTSCRSNLISWGFRGDWIRDLQMNHWFLSQAWQARSEPSMMLSSRFREPDSSGWLAVQLGKGKDKQAICWIIWYIVGWLLIYIYVCVYNELDNSYLLKWGM